MALDDFKIAVDTLTPLPGKIRDKDRRYFDLFRADRAFIVVPELFKSAYSKYVDDSLATYAIMRMNWDGYDDEKGSPKSDYDAITEKHFGLKLKNFNNGRTETIPGTENVRVGGGFSYNSGQYLIPVGDMVRNTDGSLTGEFKYYIISDSFFDWSGDVPDHAYNIDEYLLTGNDADFPEPQILQVTFEIRRDEDGEYLFYHNVKSLK